MNDEFDLQYFETNGIRVRAAVAGSGPLVIFVHGWPELWYSWRHQLGALEEAGYRAVAMDVRGYGGSDKPDPVEAYTMRELTADVVGLIDALGEQQAVLVGHDWGAPICWNTAALFPARVSAVAGLSVPHLQRPPAPPIDIMRQLFAGRFFYQLYFQEEGVAESELEQDVKTSLRSIYYVASGNASADEARTFADKPEDSGLLDGLPDPDVLPGWLSEVDLDYFAAEFEAGGFRGPINRYRAQNLDWHQLPELATLTVDQPSCFIGGAKDGVRSMIPGRDLFEGAGAHCTDFRGTTIIDGAGHWVQQEAPDTVNQALLEFLRSTR